MTKRTLDEQLQKIASDIAMAKLRETYEAGKPIHIPALGITIRKGTNGEAIVADTPSAEAG